MVHGNQKDGVHTLGHSLANEARSGVALLRAFARKV